MQTDLPEVFHQKLEQNAEPNSVNRKNRCKEWFTQFCRLIVRRLTTQDEPKIWRSQDRSGHVRWSVYLAGTGQTIRLASEEEVRLWLEENLRF